MRPAKTGTSMLSLIECRKGRRGMNGLRSKGIWDRRLQDEAFNARVPGFYTRFIIPLRYGYGTP